VFVKKKVMSPGWDQGKTTGLEGQGVWGTQTMQIARHRLETKVERFLERVRRKPFRGGRGYSNNRGPSKIRIPRTELLGPKRAWSAKISSVQAPKSG